VNIVITPKSEPTQSDPSIEPTELPPPPKTLVVCLGRTPNSLYLYGEASPEADTVLQAIYDGPVDLRVHAYEPVILTKVPSLEDGDAEIETFTVADGDLYLNPETQIPDRLSSGKPFFPPGCRESACMQTFTEGEIEMDRLVVVFELLPGIIWSDGTELTVNDSVFSFHLDANEATPSTKYLVQRTDHYEALNDLTVEWAGIPGFLDPEFESNFWSPLPEHILESVDPADISVLDEASRFPMGWGPYVIDSWIEDREILLRKSETYFRGTEGLPYFDILRFRFLGSDYVSALEQVLTGECDVLDESVFPPMLWESALDFEGDGRLRIASTPGSVVERIDFNTSRTNEFTPASIFTDIRIRQAVAACIDREGLLESVLFGLSEIPQSYLPPSHPFNVRNSDLSALSMEEAITELELMGWVDDDGDPQTPRIANGVAGVESGSPLEIRYLTIEGFLQDAVISALERDLSRCGIGIEPEFAIAQEIFEPWPNGPIFGGRFEAVGWAWPIYVTPPCEMFAGFEIPSVDYLFGINATGFGDEEYDRACQRIMNGPADGESYLEAITITEDIFRGQLPSLPLYVRPRVVAFGNTICGPDPENTAFSILWNIEDFRSGDDC
jgi:peptide/nickel transport system substrate-binding protein